MLSFFSIFCNLILKNVFFQIFKINYNMNEIQLQINIKRSKTCYKNKTQILYAISAKRIPYKITWTREFKVFEK